MPASAEHPHSNRAVSMGLLLVLDGEMAYHCPVAASSNLPTVSWVDETKVIPDIVDNVARKRFEDIS